MLLIFLLKSFKYGYLFVIYNIFESKIYDISSKKNDYDKSVQIVLVSTCVGHEHTTLFDMSMLQSFR